MVFFPLLVLALLCPFSGAQSTVTVTLVKTNSWVSGGNMAFVQFNVLLKNTGSSAVSSVCYQISLPPGASITQSWNMVSAGNGQYRTESWVSIQPGGSDSSAGFTMSRSGTSGSGTPTASVVSGTCGSPSATTPTTSVVPSSTKSGGNAYCPAPPKTAMLIYDRRESHIKTLREPVRECQCQAGVETAFFASVASAIPTTGGSAGQSSINMQCAAMEDFCVCDESDQCWRMENALAQVVINSYCDPVCHMYARLNNIAPYTQALVNTVTGRRITLADELTEVNGNPKRHAYKPMGSSVDYYVKAKSITCVGAGQCKPMPPCGGPASSTAVPPTASTPAGEVCYPSGTKTIIIDGIEISVDLIIQIANNNGTLPQGSPGTCPPCEASSPVSPSASPSTPAASSTAAASSSAAPSASSSPSTASTGASSAASTASSSSATPSSTAAPSTAACTGTFGAWGAFGACSDTCGQCGNQTLTRPCEPAGCVCSGNATETVMCNATPCTFPRNSCCNGSAKVSNGAIVCG